MEKRIASRRIRAIQRCLRKRISSWRRSLKVTMILLFIPNSSHRLKATIKITRDRGKETEKRLRPSNDDVFVSKGAVHIRQRRDEITQWKESTTRPVTRGLQFHHPREGSEDKLSLATTKQNNGLQLELRAKGKPLYQHHPAVLNHICFFLISH